MRVCGSEHIWLHRGCSHHGLLHALASAARFLAALSVSHRLGAGSAASTLPHPPRIFKESTPLTVIGALRAAGRDGCDGRTNGGWRQCGPPEGMRRGACAEAAVASRLRPRRGFYQFVCCLNYIASADQRGRNDRTSDRKPGTCMDLSNEPNSWKSGTRRHARTVYEQSARVLAGQCHRCGDRQVAACWSACLAPDNSRSITHTHTRKLGSNHQTDRGAHSASIQPKRITTRGRKAGQPPSAPRR